jgi:hypothetical protein
MAYRTLSALLALKSYGEYGQNNGGCSQWFTMAKTIPWLCCYRWEVGPVNGSDLTTEELLSRVLQREQRADDLEQANNRVKSPRR